MDVTNQDARPKLIETLKVFAALDRIRWQKSANYNLINYCSDDLTPREKILTHWLCYISDRQMPFLRVWEVGGYILSMLAKEYCRTSASVREVLDKYTVKPSTDKPSLAAPYSGGNSRLERLGIAPPSAIFTSRYMADDLVKTYRTLAILDRVASRDIIRYTSDVANTATDRAEAVEQMAVALDFLTYRTQGKAKASDYLACIDGESEKIKRDLESYRPSQHKNLNALAFKRWVRKRLWCSLRDYVKSPEFNDIYVKGLRLLGNGNAEMWHRSAAESISSFDVLELPGDVWNNNPTFRKGLFCGVASGSADKKSTPEVARRLYQTLKSNGVSVSTPSNST